MEMLCFGLGVICGILVASFAGARDTQIYPKEEEPKMPKELRAQYESLFGFDGRNPKE